MNIIDPTSPTVNSGPGETGAPSGPGVYLTFNAEERALLGSLGADELADVTAAGVRAFQAAADEIRARRAGTETSPVRAR